MKKLYILIAYLIITLTNASAQKPTCTADAYAMLKNGQQEPVAKIIVEEFLTTKHFTLLNYVFFDDSSSVIPNRYHLLRKSEEADNFNPGMQFINFEILDVYYDIINIVGFRMRQDKSLNITIKGCNSNSGGETGNLDLSKNRAESIRSYLSNIWKIEDSRMKVDEPRNLPDDPSISKVDPKLANEENRRVEIVGDWSILKPLVVNDTLRASNPPSINFITDVKTTKPIKNWKLYVKQSGTDLRKPFAGAGDPQKNLPWRINREKDKMPSGKLPIIYWLEATADLRGKSDNKQLPVEQISITTKKKTRMQSKEYQRYSLILFGFFSNDLAEHNLKILEMIKENIEIKDSTRFYITGYTDMIGGDETNKKLSLGRAQRTGKELTKYNVKANQIIEKGLGNSTNPYFKSSIENLSVIGGQYIDFTSEENANVAVADMGEEVMNFNKTPEGRFYCRTVVIEVENLVEYK
ncbi:MAG: OmpA family protein [Candidatus Kapabacteria bacterium]|nr:OmpA family protein [Candidatus Kapabacteria bacterium]